MPLSTGWLALASPRQVIPRHFPSPTASLTSSPPNLLNANGREDAQAGDSGHGLYCCHLLLPRCTALDFNQCPMFLAHKGPQCGLRGRASFCLSVPCWQGTFAVQEVADSPWVRLEMPFCSLPLGPGNSCQLTSSSCSVPTWLCSPRQRSNMTCSFLKPFSF